MNNSFGAGPIGVPESQHSIFIRGFPGDTDMSRIKDFFEKEAGHCTFDFFKQSADGSRLFVAVRFDTRDIARDTMVRYNTKEIFGHRVYMTWFKDIRRYVAYTNGQMITPPGAPPFSGAPPRGRGRILTRGTGRGGFPDNPGRGMFPPRGRGLYRGGLNGNSYTNNFYSPAVQKLRARARAPSVVPTRTIYRDKSPKSRSSSASSRNAKDGKRSESSGRSRSPTPRSKGSRSKSSDKRSRSRTRRSSPPSSYKVIKKSLDRSAKRRRNSSVSSRSSGEASVSPHRNKKLKRRRRNRSKSKSPAGSVAGSTTSHSSIKSSKGRRSPERHSRSPSSERDEPPKPVEKPKKLPSAVQAVVPLVVPSTAREPEERPLENGTTPVHQKPTSSSLVEDIFAIQKNTLENVQTGETNDKKLKLKQLKRESKQKSKERDFKLSNFTREVSAENDRQKRISSLPPEKLHELHLKRKDLEQSYKQDCDTFATVVKMLISKDPSMEEKLLSSLRDALKDIGQKFIAELNEFVDSLLLVD